MKKPQLRNGFPVVTRATVVDFAAVGIEQVESLQAMLAAIQRLAKEGDPTIAGLAAHGCCVAGMLHNDIDVIGECAEKAGVVGELVEEVRHG